MKRILISRTDSIGDVMLTLPMCVWLKDHFIDAELIYLGKGYTRPVVECFSVIDRFIDWEEISQLPTVEKMAYFQQLEADAIIHVFPNKEIASLAKKAKIPVRIGTSHRSFHLLTCNHRVGFSRKNSELHESQLNFELLRPLGLKVIPSLTEIKDSLHAFRIPQETLPENIENLLSKNDKTVILHPKSQGSAVEWPMTSYIALAEKLTHKGYTVFFTGTEKEGLLFRDLLPHSEQIIDLTGQMNLTQLIHFISLCKNLVACSTGPLHIAGFCGIRAIGLFSPKRPIHPGRWAALGRSVKVLTFDENCPDCKKKRACQCIQKISVDKVLEQIA
jgi:ADP-heptose:LPS heptosyltransferase